MKASKISRVAVKSFSDGWDRGNREGHREGMSATTKIVAKFYAIVSQALTEVAPEKAEVVAAKINELLLADASSDLSRIGRTLGVGSSLNDALSDALRKMGMQQVELPVKEPKPRKAPANAN